MTEVEEYIKPRNGVATFKGETYILVDRIAAVKDEKTGCRGVNAVAINAASQSPGYFDMTLMVLPRHWKSGEEALDAIPNGEYDWIMREQKGVLTPPRGYCGTRCHDC